ncbi:CDP-glycerol glycerophosphotransferase family protein [Niallia sp.]|uniref:CDP-glycerol glycerophosphotransferase family protein n=1 Tax=Niallia sp. TaxID=2837523 RepID=UPI00289A993D|nr:CDP-glycerol glycerophosphotransferase family protein [Niallia sp.]
MSESEVSNHKVKEIEIRENKVYIQFYFDETLLSAEQDSLLFYLKDTDKCIPFSLTQISSLDGLGLYESVIDIEEHSKAFSRKTKWEIYVQIADKQKKRLLCSEKVTGLLYYYFEKENFVFFPSTTKRGELVFRTSEPLLFAAIDRATIRKDGSIFVAGYYDFPEWHTKEPSKVTGTLIMENDLDSHISRFSLDGTGKDNSNDRFSTYRRFETTIYLTEGLHSLKKVHYRFHLEISFQDEAKHKVLKCNQLAYLPADGEKNKQKRICTISKSKKRVKVRTKTPKRYLSISVSPYYYKQQLYENTSKLFRKWKNANKLLLVYKVLFKVVGYFPVKKNSIVFESFLGKQYSCNPRAIYEYIQANHSEFKLYWSVDPRYLKNFEGKNLDVVPRFSIKWLFIMARANFWVSNSRLPLWIPKPRHTTYLQTWHGTPLKKLAADMDEVHMPETNTKMYKSNFLYEARNWDYLISPNAYSSEIFKSAFQFKKKMIESGYPRNDILYKKHSKEELRQLKEKFAIPLDKKVLLYAPTWRDDQFYKKGKYKFDLELDLNKLKRELGEEYVVILRMHYLVAENFDLSPYKGFAFDYSNYEDIRELYLISDLLITDYSSVFFDYGNLKRPIIFFVYDIETYRDKLRGFYFDFEKKAPGPLAKTTDEVIECINSGNVTNQKFNDFYNKFCYLEDGNASARVVKEVFLQ